MTSQTQRTTRHLTQATLLAEAKNRFGNDPLHWAFQCPNCSDIATAGEFRQAGVAPERVGQECLGRHRGALTQAATGTDGRGRTDRGCDWTAYGLISGPWFVTTTDDRVLPSFPLAPAPEWGEQKWPH